MKKTLTKSEKETINFASKFAQELKGGEIIGLRGDLGAGKTIFAKGLALGLNIKDNINSPTFVLMKVYDVPKNRIKKLVHIDAYRIKNALDLEAIGALEYMERKDVVTVIEWIENVEKIIPKKIQGERDKLRSKRGHSGILRYLRYRWGRPSKRECPRIKKISLKNIAENKREIIIHDQATSQGSHFLNI
jgi:tRNA threonylcarbamoyladenosine biosynthesis protein TsaE